ncbi:N-acetylmuramoyl-L-alanine amidase [Salipaludibacillus sp. HK11]|uniref:N-acetylmuramoyl-L-alanine amidase n=1 Tax=Salipaludibacillus sp. HK11 TaxID=3394320 RepID=UPI0039FCDB44
MQFPGVLLFESSSGQEVTEVQERLNSLSFNVGTADGIYGPITTSGVKQFQRANNLNDDGIVGKLTWDKLFSSDSSGNTPYPGNLLSVGSSGEDVKIIQQQLNKLDYNAGVEDGIYGSGTQSAVQSFQSDNHLKVDGIVGQVTWDSLFMDTIDGPSSDLPYPGYLIMIESSGKEVELIQTQLNRLGYFVGVVDGIYGQMTEDAVKSFQENMNTSVDGIIGQETWPLLMNASVDYENHTPYPNYLLSNGSTGDHVVAIQRQLNSKNFHVGGVDGIFGSNTEYAIIQFQSVNNLDVDGIVGRLTWDVLFGNSTTDIKNPYPGILLTNGSSGADVQRVQERLNNIGFNVGTPDGIYGPMTTQGVTNFQINNNLDSDGIVGPETWNLMFNGTPVSNPHHGDRLYPGNLLSNGSSGADVTYVQERLNYLGYSVGNADGIYGPNTESGVVAFQHDRGLQPDGVVGLRTWDALSASNGEPPNDDSDSSDGSTKGVFKVFIDPGHGGSDTGAVGHGFLEKDFNLDISLIQKHALEEAGYNVRLSRESDVFISLKQRTDMAKQWGADLFVSNHINAGGGRGSEVYYSVYDNSLYGGVGRKHAIDITNNLSTYFYNRGAKTRQGQNGDFYHVIRETNMPAVLVEQGFIDNTGDVTTLTNNLTNIAMATVNAITKLSPIQTYDPNPQLGEGIQITNPLILEQVFYASQEYLFFKHESPEESEGFYGDVLNLTNNSSFDYEPDFEQRYGLSLSANLIEGGFDDFVHARMEMGTADINFNASPSGFEATTRVSLQKFEVSKDFDIMGVSFTLGTEVSLISLGYDLRVRKGLKGYIGFGPAGIGAYFKINDD